MAAARSDRARAARAPVESRRPRRLQRDGSQLTPTRFVRAVVGIRRRHRVERLAGLCRTGRFHCAGSRGRCRSLEESAGGIARRSRSAARQGTTGRTSAELRVNLSSPTKSAAASRNVKHATPRRRRQPPERKRRHRRENQHCRDGRQEKSQIPPFVEREVRQVRKPGRGNQQVGQSHTRPRGRIRFHMNSGSRKRNDRIECERTSHTGYRCRFGQTLWRE